jgi:hypothetical protein
MSFISPFKLPGFHLAEGLVLDVLAVVAPLPFVALPVVNAANPYVGPVCVARKRVSR